MSEQRDSAALPSASPLHLALTFACAALACAENRPWANEANRVATGCIGKGQSEASTAGESLRRAEL